MDNDQARRLWDHIGELEERLERYARDNEKQHNRAKHRGRITQDISTLALTGVIMIALYRPISDNLPDWLQAVAYLAIFLIVPAFTLGDYEKADGNGDDFPWWRRP